MIDLNLAVTKTFDRERHRRLEHLRRRFPELFVPGGPPEEHVLLDLAPFFFDKPQQFYSEAVFEPALDYLTRYYAQEPAALVVHFTAVAPEVRRGALATAYFSRDIAETSLHGIERQAKVLRYWAPWYQNLESCLKETVSPWFWAVARATGEKSTLDGTPYLAGRTRTLDKVPALAIVTEHFDATVRKPPRSSFCATGRNWLPSTPTTSCLPTSARSTSWRGHIRPPSKCGAPTSVATGCASS